MLGCWAAGLLSTALAVSRMSTPEGAEYLCKHQPKLISDKNTEAVTWASHSDPQTTCVPRHLSVIRAIENTMAVGSEIPGRGRLGTLSWRY